MGNAAMPLGISSLDSGPVPHGAGPLFCCLNAGGERPFGMTRGSRTLGDIAARMKLLEVRCSRCTRAGRHSTAKLVERWGAELPMPDLARRLAGACAKLTASEPERCDVHFPGLVEGSEGRPE